MSDNVGLPISRRRALAQNVERVFLLHISSDGYINSRAADLSLAYNAQMWHPYNNQPSLPSPFLIQSWPFERLADSFPIYDKPIRNKFGLRLGLGQDYG